MMATSAFNELSSLFTKITKAQTKLTVSPVSYTFDPSDLSSGGYQCDVKQFKQH